MNISLDEENVILYSFLFLLMHYSSVTALQELSTTTGGDFVGPGARLKVTQTL